MIRIQVMEALGLVLGGYWHEFYVRNGGTVGIVMTVVGFLALIGGVIYFFGNLHRYFSDRE